MMKNRSVPVATVLPRVIYENVPEALSWLARCFGFTEHYRYGERQYWAEQPRDLSPDEWGATLAR